MEKEAGFNKFARRSGSTLLSFTGYPGRQGPPTVKRVRTAYLDQLEEVRPSQLHHRADFSGSS
jgi:hypothetical protein